MQGVNTGESGAPNGEQGMRTQEIHIVSSNAHRQAYASMQNQRLQKQFEPMTFSNTPLPAEKEGHRRGKAESTPRWRFAFVASLIAIDLAVMLLSLTVSLVINGAAFDAIGDVMPFWLFLILFSLIWLLCLAFAGTYHRHVMADGYELYAKIINASLLTIISYCSLAFIFKLALPRTALIIAPVIAFFLDIIARWQMRQALHRHRSKGSCKYRTVVIGSSDGINKALQTMRNCMNWGYEPVAVCPIEADPASKDAYVVTSYTPDANIEGSSKLKVIPFNSAFPRICESLGVQEVYVADVLSRDFEMLHGLSLAVESLGMELALAVSLADVSGHRLYLRNTTEQPVLLASLPQYTGAANVIKRLLDIIGSLCALIISSPILLGVAIAIKLDDGGPVFFSQTRIGLHGKPFKMYKFRSMVTNAEELKKKLAEETGQEDRFIFKMKDDPRITKVGHFIRKTSLDEFPQFYNVLKGDMSLVGPRPALPEEVARYGSLYSARLLVKPGITGPWQVSGRSDLSQEQSEYLDVSYIENWSIAGDLAILAKTVMVIFTGRGSY
ncbi:sugar transferase [Bifidobacterium adolescentis]|nr:sugar transferase [Bifidobacterium adolescentis]KAB5643042.1 sugar transferase [Bifidobacterium adolescentis]KAB5646294.1 sugar transferase [Bifidobacterium adolescentis]KAB5646782.1 sugar transferase [Bifidobacterium adolescentis]KAB5650669.1 sugar transferase [Bifidobacterium adolescentis]